MVEPLRPEDPRRLGPYRLLGRLGAGGMGQVFLGRDPAGAAAAVKTLHLGAGYDAELVERFRREVESAAKIRSEYTARVLDADPAGAPPWLATEYLAGLTLAEVEDLAGALPEELVRRLGAALAGGLAAIHSARVVHRDLKPSNVLVLADQIKIIDFGIARPDDAPRLTASQYFHGTVGYIAPERFAGKAGTPASDVFALAAMLVRAATGRLPFEGANMAEYLYAVHYSAPNLVGVPAGMTWTLRKCLEAAPEDRPTARQVRERLAAGLPEPAGPWLPAPVLAAIAGRQRAAAGLLRQGRDRPWRAGHAMVRGEIVVAGPTVVLSADDGVQALEAGDGTVRWRHPEPTAPGYRPLVAGDTVISPAPKRLVALDLQTGRERWALPVAPHGEPVYAHGLVHVLGPGKRNLFALDADTGAEVWRTAAAALRPVPVPAGVAIVQGLMVRERRFDGTAGWSHGELPAPAGGLTVAGDLVLVRSGDALLGLGARDGALRLRRTGLPPRVAPAATAEIVVQPAAGELLGLDPADGSLRWRFALAHDRGTPHAVPGAVFVTEPESLTALGPDGEVRWKVPGVAVWPGVHATGTLVYVVDAGVLRAYSRHDGTVRWSAPDIHVTRAPVAGDGVLYVDNGYTLFAINADDGERLPT
ncbi:protein kinase domain-containing protein [Dactylosporangium matsuzakiense]|uniref:serine/threonine-protein kinase n=1 Tax=Dactylosporangium matsuzakiense TaxID=53360 RepID=UPI0021C2D155|nr:serine/threonine-protein kinase [Dactylosporangium matsuzakiense]UWZ47689.1 PQQ-binding-like beta-propeller repeat protein [Dactylosporangium matsuzakiense]